MNLQTVIDNLNRTIEGKELLLEKFDPGVGRNYLLLNIDELKRIRDDLLKVKA